MRILPRPFTMHAPQTAGMLIGLFLCFVLGAENYAQAQSAGASILPKQEVLERQSWWDNQDWNWYRANIPFFESPDAAIDATYYYRWKLVTKHLTYGSPTTGYTFTEFIDRPTWSGAYGAISCPLGHQFYEIRWLKDRRVIYDFAHYWFDTPGAEPRSYSNWYGNAMWAVYKVWQDRDFIAGVYPHMQQQYRGWVKEQYDPEHGMFISIGMYDGMEVNINSRQTGDKFFGAEGYRPTLNSYMYGDLLALAKTAALLGDAAKARMYAQKARALKQRVQGELWDPDRQFFFHQFAYNEKGGIEAKTLTYETGTYAGSPHGRELIGYIPWYFNLPDPGYEAAWKFLMDENYFWAPYGPTTVEQNDPLFYVSPTCCVWSGNSWPYATTQTLVALANLLNNYEQDYVDKEDYFNLLKVYTRTQRWKGRPYIAEAANPFTGSWEGHNSYYHSEHYFHSGYVDLIITGLVGLRPRADDTLEVNPLVPEAWDYFALEDVAYHGHNVSIVWDRDGSHYGLGKGLMLFVNGQKVASSPTVQRMKVKIPPAPNYSEPTRPINFAINNGRGYFPLIMASYSHLETPPFYANDGNYWYHPSPPNRWTTVGSPNESDWIAIDFGIERPISMLKLYFIGDSTGTRPPDRYEVQMWDGAAWTAIPGQQRQPADPMGHRPNVVTFDEQKTSRIRIILYPQPGAAVGLTELEAWGEAELPLLPPVAPVANLAYDASGSNDETYPQLEASYTNPHTQLGNINDMERFFTPRTDNVWHTQGSPNGEDWIEVDFGRPKLVHEVDLYLWCNGDEVRAPDHYTVRYWREGQWTDATLMQRWPEQPTCMAVNTVKVEPVEAEKIRVVFEHRLPGHTGLTELMVWGDRSH